MTKSSYDANCGSTFHMQAKARFVNPRSGFTVLELMIALVLGLLIVAAGTAVFLSGQRSLGLQGSMNELQQNANFGLAMIAHDLRHANLNTDSTQRVNNKVVGSGVIFDIENLPSSLRDSVGDTFFTRENVDEAATDIANDQLTIQYIPEYRKIIKRECTKEDGCEDESEKEDLISYEAKNVDCEGQRMVFDEPRIIVQRYHLKPDPVQISGQPRAYSLYCDAGHYVAGNDVITGMSDAGNGQQLMQRIDAFKVRLGVKAPNKTMRYMTIDEYIDAMDGITDEKEYLNVMSVEIGILARSTTPLNQENLINTSQLFNVIGNEMTLKTGAGVNNQQGTKYLREVFSQVVAFRNTLGAS